MQRVGLHLTDRCQLDCVHCLRDPGKKPKDLELAVIDAVLRDAAENYGIARLSLTGGEPTLHPEFGEILDLAVRYRMSWDMVTNGHRFVRLLELFFERPERKRACAQIVFSLDGASDRVHDSIRGEGQRREVLGAAAAALAADIPFGIATTLHARNVEELEAIGFEAAQLGARHITYAMMQPTGTHLDSELRLEPDEWRSAHERISRLAAVLRVPVNAAEGWPNRQPMQTCNSLRGDTLHIDQFGRLTLCCLLADVPGGGAEVVGDASQGLRPVHAGLIDLQRDALKARLGEIGQDVGGPWEDFGCNGCLRRFGKVHWNEDGTSGATARRERWNGALPDARLGRKALKVVR